MSHAAYAALRMEAADLMARHYRVLVQAAQVDPTTASRPEKRATEIAHYEALVKAYGDMAASWARQADGSES